MNQRYDSLMAIITRVKRRWKMKMALRGLAAVSLSLAVLFILAVLLARYFNFNPAALWTLRFLAVGSLVWVGAVFLVLPLMRRVDDLQVARYIEEHHPGLEQRLTSAVELGQHGVPLPSPYILRRLVEDALVRCHRVDLRQLIQPRLMAGYGLATLAGFLILVGLLSFGPAYVPYGAAKLFAAWTQAADRLPFKVSLLPGNATVQRGSDQQIRASFEGFAPDHVLLYWKEDQSQSWETMQMRPDTEGAAFVGLFANLSVSREYYGEADGYKSPAYRLLVEDLPRVSQIDLTYFFPAYTGLAPKQLENQGNISALKGTTVRLSAISRYPASAARLQLSDGSFIPLKSGAEHGWAGELLLRISGSYVVQLADPQGEWHVASDEYPIEVLQDKPPEVVMTRPGRDYRASRIEEVYLEAKATDDLRVARLELRYSVNGQEEKSQELYRQERGAGLTAAAAGFTFFLEEMPVKVGDVISYYAQATDGNPEAGEGKASSDMFFVEVTAFDKNYSQSQQRGMPGGSNSQGGESTGALAKQQKEIIAATWRLIRSQPQMEKREFAENVRTVALIQSQLREKTTGLAATITARLASAGNTQMAKLATMLKEAASEMERAEAQLGAQGLSKALPHEQAALKKLLEAENFYRDVQVQLSSSMDAQSQAAMNWEDLSELFELELDRIRNQYESLRQDAVKRRDETQDEALRRLKELAQRQEQFLERQRRMQAQQGAQGASGSAGRQEEMQRQQELIEQAEALKRKLEQLSRDGQDQRMADAARRLQQATDQMKQALQQMRNSQSNSAQVAGTQALQQIQEAERLLNSAQSGQSAKTVEQLQQSIRDLQSDEKKVQESVERLASGKEDAAPDQGKEARARVNARKDLMASKLETLEAGLDRAARELSAEQREAGKKLQEARGAIRERRVRDKVIDGKGFIDKGWFDFAKAREDNIARDLKDLGDMLAQAQGQIANRPGERLQKALNQTRDLVDSLESMRRRLGEPGQQSDQNQPGQQGQPGQQSDQSQPGQQGEQGQQGQGRQGQPGEQGRQGQTAGQGGDRMRDARQATVNGGAIPGGSARADADPVRLTPDQVRQLQKEYEERLRQAQGILPDLKEDRELASEMEALLARMRGIEGAGLGVSAASLAQLSREVLDPLKQFELSLSRRLGELSAKNKLSRPSEDDIPAGYRKMVDEYFKKIAVK